MTDLFYFFMGGVVMIIWAGLITKLKEKNNA